VTAASGPALQTAARHRGAAFGDFDNDGRVDFVVTRIGEPATLLRNISEPDNHWLALRLRGRKSNRDGIGAFVEVIGASGHRQWNRLTTATGYASSSQAVAFFGMHKDKTAKRVEILWPSGTRQVLENVACDRYVNAEEPVAQTR
jgi:hypothetical protein